jgi:uncharacterized integral membrane protein
MRHLKLGLLIVVLVLAGAVILQNMEPIKTKLLFGTLEMPLAALLAMTLLVGYGLGLLTTAIWQWRSWRSQALAAKRQSTGDQASSSG